MNKVRHFDHRVSTKRNEAVSRWRELLRRIDCDRNVQSRENLYQPISKMLVIARSRLGIFVLRCALRHSGLEALIADG
jgi:hypothetical protein